MKENKYRMPANITVPGNPIPCLRSAALLLLALFPNLAGAQWQRDGNPLCMVAGDQWRVAMVCDGRGGAIVTWEDGRRGGLEHDIYAARITASGRLAPGWPSNGAAVISTAGYQGAPAIAPDGSGGAAISWIDSRTGLGLYDIYSQRITEWGLVSPGWPADGVALCTNGACGFPVVAADGAAGEFVGWADSRQGEGIIDLYMQRVIGGGSLAPGWPSDGMAVSTAPGYQVNPAIVSDGLGGAIVAWDTAVGDASIYVQRVTSSGGIPPGWPVNGLVVCQALGQQVGARIVGDGAGGAIIAWTDYRSGAGDIYAQRITASAVVAQGWPLDGLPVCTAVGEHFLVALVSDAAGGAIAVWEDSRGGTDADIYASRITAAGAIGPGWPANGLAVCVAPGEQLAATVVTDQAGDAIVAWQDHRNGADYRIFAQRVTSSGAIAPGWPADGLALSSAPGDQVYLASASDGTGGAIVAWGDQRNGTDYDVYTQRVTASGETGSDVEVPPLPMNLSLHAPIPNPMRDRTVIAFDLPADAQVRADVLDLGGRRLRTLAAGYRFSAGTRALFWDGSDNSGAALPNGLYLVRVQAGTQSGAVRISLIR